MTHTFFYLLNTFPVIRFMLYRIQKTAYDEEILFESEPHIYR